MEKEEYERALKERTLNRGKSYNEEHEQTTFTPSINKVSPSIND